MVFQECKNKMLLFEVPKRDLRPAPADFDVMQGSTLTIDYTIKSGGVAIDLDTWTNLRASATNGTLRFDFTVVDIDHSNGVGQLLLPASSTVQVPSPGYLDWDFFGVDPSGNDRCLSRGRLHFTPMVSNA